MTRTWRCDNCQSENEVVFAANIENHLALLLALEQCNWCLALRNPGFYHDHCPPWRCPHCGLFPPYIKRIRTKGGDMCEAGRHMQWEKNKKTNVLGCKGKRYTDYIMAIKGVRLSEEHKAKLREAKLKNPVRYWFGKKRPEVKSWLHTPEVHKKISDTERGRPSPLKGTKLPPEWCKNVSKGKNGKPNWKIAGKLSHLWKGGIYPEHLAFRKTSAYKEWRRKVFERDDYRCHSCGARSGETQTHVQLEADHIYPFALFPRLRLMVENGRTLCKPCHRETETYGVRIKTYAIA